MDVRQQEKRTEFHLRYSMGEFTVDVHEDNVNELMGKRCAKQYARLLKVSAMCNRGEHHNRCTMRDCVCECHRGDGK